MMISGGVQEEDIDFKVIFREGVLRLITVRGRIKCGKWRPLNPLSRCNTTDVEITALHCSEHELSRPKRVIYIDTAASKLVLFQCCLSVTLFPSSGGCLSSKRLIVRTPFPGANALWMLQHFILRGKIFCESSPQSPHPKH
jgi:hypothetical protein